MTANELSFECMIGILPWFVIAVMFAVKTMCTVIIVQYKNVKLIKRRGKGYWTKNGPRWKARLSPDQIRCMQQEVQKRKDARLLAIKIALATNNDDPEDCNCSECGECPTLVARTTSTRSKLIGVQRIKFDTDSIRIAVDTGASRTISSHSTDFEGEITPTKRTIDGIASGLEATGIGTIHWTTQDDQGRVHVVRIPNSLYVPASPIRILSPQHWAQEMDDNYPKRRGTWCATYDNGCELFWQQNKYVKTVKHDSRSNVPIMTANHGTKKYRAIMAAEQCLMCNEHEQSVCYKVVCRNSTHNVLNKTHNDKSGEPKSDGKSKATVEENSEQDDSPYTEAFTINTEAFKEEETVYHDLEAREDSAELLRWHQRLNHFSFRGLKLLAKMQLLPKRIINAKIPRCACCVFGTMTRKPWRNKGQPSKLKKATRAGQVVSVDQMESGTPGLIAQLKGRLTRQRYNYATVYVDHFSRLGYIHLQRTLTSEETLEGKKQFEAYCNAHGVTVENYHADNGRFADNAFINDVRSQGQTITYCGVGAHHQNGIAEKRIRDVTEQARKMLLHACSRWPSAVTTALWPYAVRQAQDVRNYLPMNESGQSPMELFAGTDVAPRLADFHTFGCPIFALDHRLQGKKSVPRWDSRARLGIYLGKSPIHARNVSNVLSTSSGCVSPQFHVIHDDFFETVQGDMLTRDVTIKWKLLAGFTRDGIEDQLPKHDVIINKKRMIEGSANKQARRNRQCPSREQTTVQQEEPEFNEGGENQAVEEGPAVNTENVAVGDEATEAVQWPMQRQPTTAGPTTRSGRRVRIPQRLIAVNAMVPTDDQQEPDVEELMQCMHADEYKTQQDMGNPIAFMSKMNGDKDTMYYHEAMKQHDSEHFVNAIVKEFNDHVERKHWSLINKRDVPEGVKVIPSVWSMKRKRDITTRKVIKYKARLNVHGGKQEHGVNYLETYSPVVGWWVIRLFFTLALLSGWKSRQVDFVLAYPQAPIEFDLYMQLPKGIESKFGSDKVLRLNKNLYGQKQAGRQFHIFARDNIVANGWKQSVIDECVFYKDGTIMLMYVDDLILLNASNNAINEEIVRLKQLFDIDDMGLVKDYIGVKVCEHDGKISLTQPQLIDEILCDVGITERDKPVATPAMSTKILRRFLREPPHDEKLFHYRSVVGKLNYLEKTSRPEIAYAVHQCARYSSNPRRSHTQAVIYLAKYLKGTRDCGMVLNPKPDEGVVVYADADWSGNWNHQEAEDDEATAKSRSGYVALFANCIILFSSKIQSLVSLSTTEAEYISLSQSLRETIPIMNMLDEVRKYKLFKCVRKAQVKCTVFEDNTGALELAMVPKIRPRTKHINNKYHHFRSAVRTGRIGVEYVPTKEQLADIFTKPLDQNTFLYLRKKLMGW